VEIDVTGKPVLDGDISLERTFKIDKNTGKLATDLTPKSSIIEKKFLDSHCILHYVDKDNPRGPVPSDPASADSAYASWEGAVQEWLKKKIESSNGEFSSNLPPTQYDDLHIEANKPSIFIVSPGSGATIEGSTITASVNVFAPRGVKRVEYFIDNRLVATNFSSPFNLSYNINTYFPKGFHKLKAVAYDDVDNNNESEIDINLRYETAPPSLTWQTGSANLSYAISAFPIHLSAGLTDFSAIKKVDFFYNQDNLISSVIFPGSSEIGVDWNSVFERGQYEVYAEITDTLNNKFKSNVLSINVY